MTRTIRAPRGAEVTCLGWPQEAAMRMLMNNLDPEVAERPEDLVTEIREFFRPTATPQLASD